MTQTEAIQMLAAWLRPGQLRNTASLVDLMDEARRRYLDMVRDNVAAILTAPAKEGEEGIDRPQFSVVESAICLAHVTIQALHDGAKEAKPRARR